jgi:hypothetical protein
VRDRVLLFEFSLRRKAQLTTTRFHRPHRHRFTIEWPSQVRAVASSEIALSSNQIHAFDIAAELARSLPRARRPRSVPGTRWILTRIGVQIPGAAVRAVAHVRGIGQYAPMEREYERRAPAQFSPHPQGGPELGTRSATDLLLNVAPVVIPPGTSVSVARLRFESPDQLRRLRAEYGEHVLFVRSGEFIRAAHLVDDVRPFDVDTEKRDLAKDTRLAARLIERSIVSRLLGLGRTILDVDPIHFLSNKETDDVVKATGSLLPAWLRIRLAFRIHARVRYLSDHVAEPIVIADTHIRHDIELRVSDLLREGVDVRGLYVVEDVSVSSEPFRRRPLVGRVEGIDGGVVILGDHRKGRDRLPTSDVYLEPRIEATERCVERLLGNRAAQVLKAIEDCTRRMQSAESRRGRIQATMDFLAREDLVLAAGASARIGSLVSQQANTFWPTRTASRITYVFDPRGVKLSDRNAEGLQRHGPYSSRTSFNPSPRICVVAEASEQGEIERFLYKFFEGIDGTIYAKGFRGLFAMNPKQPTFFLARDGSPSAFRRAVQQAVEASAADGVPWDLALVQSRENTRMLRGDQNPYLVTKAVFLGHQIPVQAFRIETTYQSDPSLPYSLRNMALGVYAKLGGTPWLLKSTPTTTHELVIGLGSAWASAGRLGDRQRLVGITSLFSGDGSYWLHTLSRAALVEEYQQAVTDSVIKAIEQVRHARNWSKGDQVRLVFHAFKPFRNKEAEAVLSIASSLPDFDIQTAFVHVVADSPYTLFDLKNSGRNGRGRLVPARGPIVEVGDRQALVLATGANELKRPGAGLPQPLLLQLHGRSSFTDMSYLADQVFHFTSHSWRGFLPAEMPVTVGYSQQIARLLSRLRDVSCWSPDSLYGKIGFTRWFL